MTGTEQPLVRLAELAVELGTDVDTLVRRLDPDSVLVDAVGFRAVERHVAARLIDEHRATQTRNKQRAADRQQRLAAASQRVQSTLRGGIPTASDNPLADLLAIDGNPRIEEAEARLEGWLRGVSTGGRISPMKGA